MHTGQTSTLYIVNIYSILSINAWRKIKRVRACGERGQSKDVVLYEVVREILSELKFKQRPKGK